MRGCRAWRNAGIVLAAWACAAGAAPTNNPVAAHYGDVRGWPAWTDGIAWSRVVDMKTYARGANDFERFENARDELAAQGGGVLYYPAGTYDFRDAPLDGPNGRGLMLRSGVVIRGEAPAGPVDPAQGRLEPLTRFLFPFRDRSDVAVDAGTRARMWIRGALAYEVTVKGRGGAAPTTETRRGDLYLSLAVRDGAWQADDAILALGSEPCTGAVARVTRSGDAVTVVLSAPVRVGRDLLSVSNTATLRVGEGGALTGTHAGTGPLAAAGSVEGRIETIVPEAPRDWSLVGLMPEKGGRIKDVHNVGLCWVTLVGATVYFGPDVAWGPTWKTAGSWKSFDVKDAWADRVADGTHPMDPFCGGGKEYVGSGSGRLVFGCRLEQAVVVNNATKCGVKHHTAPPEGPDGFGPDGFHTFKFGPRIGVYGSRVLVAGNVIPMAAGRNFKYRQRTIRTTGQKNDIAYGATRESVLLFDYNRACGIDVNKDLLGLVRDSIREPSSDTGYYAPGVVVRDNWVFNNGHKGYNLAGRWLTIASNRNERTVLRLELNPYMLGGYRLALDGFSEVSGGGGGSVSDTLSRAFDLGGQNLWVDGNGYNNLGSAGNDGEGILCQAHGGTDLYSWAVTRNVHEKGLGQTSYIGGWGVVVHGCLIAWNTTPGWVGQAGPRDDFDAAYVANRAASVNTSSDSPALRTAPTERPTAPADVRAEPVGTDAVSVTYRDTTDHEIGFRVERSVDGGTTWTVVAYRPPQREKSPDNPPAWTDFSAPAGKPLLYRVLAIGVDDGDDAASAPVAAPALTPRP